MSRATKNAGEPGSWVMGRRAMKESPAWRAASDDVRRLLDRLELEHMRHGGGENGRLAVTYEGFIEWGLRRRGDIAKAVRHAAALGFLEVVRKGSKAWGGEKFPSLYRLTYVWGRRAGRGGEPPTDEWERITTDEEAQAALQRADGDAERARARRRQARAKAA